MRPKRLSEADPFLSGVGTMLADHAPSSQRCATAPIWRSASPTCRPTSRRARGRRSTRVRLNGPYSDKALLGLGWADAALGDYQGALTPWMELRSRNVLDSAVQESYLAVPYAFSKLNANAQSAEYYESAVNSFDAENARLDAAIARIRQGRHAQARPATRTRAGEELYGWFWQLKNLPDAPESRYLYAVLAGHDFQEGLKNYRDLVYLGGTLAKWDDNMVAFEDMIETREHAYRRAAAACGCAAGLGARRASCSSATRRSRTSCAPSRPSTTSQRSVRPRSATSGHASSASRPP